MYDIEFHLFFSTNFIREHHCILLQVNGKADNHTPNGGDDDDEDEEVKGVPDIKIQGNVIKIDRKDVVWSSDEYEESDEEEATSKVKFGMIERDNAVSSGTFI